MFIDTDQKQLAFPTFKLPKCEQTEVCGFLQVAQGCQRRAGKEARTSAANVLLQPSFSAGRTFHIHEGSAVSGAIWRTKNHHQCELPSPTHSQCLLRGRSGHTAVRRLVTPGEQRLLPGGTCILEEATAEAGTA